MIHPFFTRCNTALPHSFVRGISTWAARFGFPALPPTPCPALPEFAYPLSPTAFVDVFNAGTAPMTWTVESDEPWIQFTPASGTADARVQVTIDWAHAPQIGEAMAPSTSSLPDRIIAFP